MNKQTYFSRTDRRKTDIAQVKLLPGGGAIIVNGTPYEDVFPRVAHRQTIVKPLMITETLDKYSVMVKVVGGGVSGQSGAISHGIARALVLADPALKDTLKECGHLTRDPRMKERKKYGQPGARKRYQFSKR